MLQLRDDLIFADWNADKTWQNFTRSSFCMTFKHPVTNHLYKSHYWTYQLYYRKKNKNKKNKEQVEKRGAYASKVREASRCSQDTWLCFKGTYPKQWCVGYGKLGEYSRGRVFWTQSCLNLGTWVPTCLLSQRGVWGKATPKICMTSLLVSLAVLSQTSIDHLRLLQPREL